MIWRPLAMLGLFLISLASSGALWLFIVTLILPVAGWALVEEVRDHHGR